MLGDKFQVVKKPRKTIDLTSMIDVIFILLLFFMVSTTFSKLGIPINQPESSQAERLDPITVLVGITKEGEYIYENDTLNDETLSQLVEAKLKLNDKTVFVLHPDKETETQHLITALDLCKESGATQFSIATKKISESR